MKNKSSTKPRTRVVSPVKSKVEFQLGRVKGLLTPRARSDWSSDYRFNIPSPYACEYLGTKESVTLTESTVVTYEHFLCDFSVFLHRRGKSVLNCELTDVIEYIEECVRQENRKSTLEVKLAAIKGMFKFVRLRMDDGEYLSLDPIELELIDLTEYNTPPEIERESLSKEEVRRLFDSVNSYRNRMMLIVVIETAIRNSDLRTIRVRDVDLDQLIIHVYDPKNSKPYDVPISEELAVELEIWLEEYRDGYVVGTDSEYLFPSHHSEKIETNGGLNSIVKEAAEEAGIQSVIAESKLTPRQKEILNTDKDVREWHRVTMHTLRHTCLSLMSEDGVELKYVQLVANHDDPRTTMDYVGKNAFSFKPVHDQFDPPR